jgi:uncharacterized OsmC-like protein
MTCTTSEYVAGSSAVPGVEPNAGFSLGIRLYAGFEQIVDFRMAGVAVLGLDECPPRGKGWGPSPTHLMGAAVGACLGAALLSRLRAQKVEVRDMHTDVTGSIACDSRGVRRVDRIVVRLSPIFDGDPPAAMPPVAELVADSIVAQSIGESVRLELSIVPQRRRRIDHQAGAASAVSYSPPTRQPASADVLDTGAAT